MGSAAPPKLSLGLRDLEGFWSPLRGCPAALLPRLPCLYPALPCYGWYPPGPGSLSLPVSPGTGGFGLPARGASSHGRGGAQMGGLRKRKRSSRGVPKRRPGGEGLLLLLPRAFSSGFLPPAKRPQPRRSPGLRRLLSAAIPARPAGAASGHGARLSRAKVPAGPAAPDRAGLRRGGGSSVRGARGAQGEPPERARDPRAPGGGWVGRAGPSGQRHLRKPDRPRSLRGKPPTRSAGAGGLQPRVPPEPRPRGRPLLKSSAAGRETSSDRSRQLPGELRAGSPAAVPLLPLVPFLGRSQRWGWSREGLP